MAINISVMKFTDVLHKHKSSDIRKRCLFQKRTRRRMHMDEQRFQNGGQGGN